jgi:dimethylhistidine N-methyltransferase
MKKSGSEISNAVNFEKDQFLADIVAGLSQPAKRIHCKYFYDQRGSELFDQICELDEYYLTRAEQSIMDQFSAEMAEQLGAQVMLVEYGSGSSSKTQVLLPELLDPAAYVPVDISEEHLLTTAEKLRHDFPDIEVLPTVADFTRDFELPVSNRTPSHAAVYFPGSTIGNFEANQAENLLTKIASVVGHDGGLLIGIDLQKDPKIIHAAYNDSEGVTEAFNLNLLHRINNELEADFDLDNFEHLAEYNGDEGRIEIFIVSTCDQTVTIGDLEFRFKARERIFTEFSHKYTVDGFCELAARAEFELHKQWTDSDGLFAVLHLVKVS